MKQQTYQGFTLIELIVVIGIIAILAAIVIVAVNPARQFSQARNTQRNSDVRAVVSAANQYAADNNGSITGLGVDVCTATPEVISGSTFGSGGASTLTQLMVPTYLSSIPADPQPTSGDYTICIDTTGGGNRVKGNAPSAELGKVITISQ